MKRLVAITFALLRGGPLGVVPRAGEIAVPFAVALLGAQFAQVAQASPAKLAAARQQYAVGDIPTAARALQGIVRGGGLSAAQLEDARKLLGICQFLLGNKPQAETMFKTVLRANPSARLNPKDVIDPAINELFNRLKPRSAPTAAKRAPASARNLRAASVPQARKGFSGIHVKTNAQNATVFANGIFIGTANQDIALDPGEHKITISAQDFEEVTRAFNVRPSERLTLTVNLVKAGERERRAALLAARGKAKRDADNKRAQAEAEKKRREKENLDYTSALPPGAKPSKASQSLADEFFRDGESQAMRPVPPPQQQNPYAYQQPRQSPPPVAYAPPPQQPGYNAYGQPAPYASGQPTLKRKSMFLAFVPLGVGQFQNGDVGLGIGFAAVQVGGLAAWYMYDQQALTYARTSAKCSEVPSGAECTPDDDHSAYVSQLNNFAMYGLVAFGLGYAGSVAEALFNMNTPSRPATRPPPAAPAPYYGFEDSRQGGSRAWALETTADAARLAPVVQVSPLVAPLKGALGLNLRIDF